MNASAKVEDLTVHFYRVERCGFYARRQPEPLCGALHEIIPELHDWVSQKTTRIADTATYERDVRGTYLSSYCIDSHRHDSSADRLMTLWIETEVTEDNSFASVSGASRVGSPKVNKEQLGVDDIPGIPAYFWILPSLNLIATVRFRRQMMHVSDLRRYLRGFLETHYSGAEKRSSATNNHAIIGVRNSGDTPMHQIDARVELKRVETNTDIQAIFSQRNSIRKIIRKKTIKLSDPNDRTILSFARRMIGLDTAVYPGDVDSSMRFKLEIEQRPSREELETMIEEFEVDDGWSDLGFAMSDSDQYIRWLSGAYSKEELSVSITRKADGIVSLPHLMAALQERRAGLIRSFNRSPMSIKDESDESDALRPRNVTQEFPAHGSIASEDAVVLVTRDGRILRQAPERLASARIREGNEALALVGGSTNESLILFTNRGYAYNLRINALPKSTDHGTFAHQLCKFKDGERVIAAVGTDPRVMPEFATAKPNLGAEYEEPYPHMIAVTRGGMALRFTLWPHKEPSTSRGRMFGKTREGDEFITTLKVYAEDDVAVLSGQGRLLVVSTQEVSLLGGPGLGVTLIKLDGDDALIAAVSATTAMEVEKATGGTQKVLGRSYKSAARGGRGVELWKRGAVKRVTLPEPAVPDLAIEAEDDEKLTSTGKK